MRGGESDHDDGGDDEEERSHTHINEEVRGRLDDDGPWQRTAIGGEKGRVGPRTEERKERKERKERSCKEEAEEGKRPPRACKMKRIMGLHTSRRGRKTCGGRRTSD